MSARAPVAPVRVTPRAIGVLLWRAGRDAHRNRITAVAAEVAFFFLLALPSFILVLAGAAGYVSNLLGPGTQDSLREWVIGGLGTFINPSTMEGFIRPSVENLFERGRGDLLSIGAVLALWSASRGVRVLIEAMNLAYDIEEWRPGWRRRLVALGLAAAGIGVLAIVLPFLVAGPRLGEAIGDAFGIPSAFGVAWSILYWPVAGMAGIAILATLYHVGPHQWTPWRRDVPGAVLAAVLWIAAAFAVRIYAQQTLSESAIGPLAAPAVLLLWIYVSAAAVLVGGEFNSEIGKMWPLEAGEAGESAQAAGEPDRNDAPGRRIGTEASDDPEVEA